MRSAATIYSPFHIGFPVYNGQSCMPMIKIPIDIEFIWMGYGIIDTSIYFL